MEDEVCVVIVIMFNICATLIFTANTTGIRRTLASGTNPLEREIQNSMDFGGRC